MIDTMDAPAGAPIHSAKLKGRQPKEIPDRPRCPYCGCFAVRLGLKPKEHGLPWKCSVFRGGCGRQFEILPDGKPRLTRSRKIPEALRSLWLELSESGKSVREIHREYGGGWSYKSVARVASPGTTSKYRAQDAQRWLAKYDSGMSVAAIAREEGVRHETIALRINNPAQYI